MGLLWQIRSALLRAKKNASLMRQLFLSFLIVLSFCHCQKLREAKKPLFVIEAAHLGLPKFQGWQEDTALQKANPNTGGVIFRLVREDAVPGSPRIDIALEPLTSAISLEALLTRNLQEMAALENKNQIHIQNVEQQEIRFKDTRAFRVKHEYTLGDATNSIAISQISIFTIENGQGLTITVAGRSELFQPLVPEINKILTGLEIYKSEETKPVKEEIKPEPPKKEEAPSTEVKPIDLGTLGGEKK